MNARLLRLVPFLLVFAALCGCSTKRTLFVTSEPTGARIWVNGEDKGLTPIAIPFIYYGTFDIRIEKLGYDAFAAEVRIPDQIDAYPVVDLPFELIVKQRDFHYRGRLKPTTEESDEALSELVHSAEAFRERTLREARPDPPPAPAPTPTPAPGAPGR